MIFDGVLYSKIYSIFNKPVGELTGTLALTSILFIQYM